VEYQGDIAWKVSIQYQNMGADDPLAVGPLKRARSVDTTGGTQHISCALKKGASDYSEKVYGPSGFGDAASMKGAIGVEDGRVNGVDIVVPALQWSENYDVPARFVTDAYIRNIAILTGKVNAAEFRGFDAGEVLFVGATGSHDWDTEKGNSPCPLTFRFVASPNRGVGMTMESMSVGDITGIEKMGHEYLWVRYSADVDATKQQVVRHPVAVYVNKVYEDGDFSLLGIGVT
jgi:hypothetical protein